MKNYIIIFSTQACEFTLIILNIYLNTPKPHGEGLTPTGSASLNAVHGVVWAIL